MDEHVIENHLRGNIVAGIYPMLPDETCCFLAIDFDEADWQNDINALRTICTEFAIPFAVERSRSGNGGHVWFFFENPLSAALARKFGSALLTFSMNRRHEIHFKSYDRLFPSQDTMPKGGLGNLIACRCKKRPGKITTANLSMKIFNPIVINGRFCRPSERFPKKTLQHLISKLCPGHELGVLKIDEEEESVKPWETLIRSACKKVIFQSELRS